MKSNNFLKNAVCFLIILSAAVFSGFSAFAVDESLPAYDESVYSDPIQTQPPQQTETQPYVPETEPVQQETTEYEEPTQTEPVQEETEATAQAQYIQPEQQGTTYFQAPTVAKTVSKKKYSTNYTAGIISWACVGIGVVVAAAVLLSTKINGRKAMGR